MRIFRILQRFESLKWRLDRWALSIWLRQIPGVFQLPRTLGPENPDQLEDEFENLLQIDHEYYRSTYADLKDMDEESLRVHYRRYGYWEGREAHRLSTRAAFVAGQPKVSSLEIGPFFSPALNGSHVKYADVLSTKQLEERAEQSGFDKLNVPEIHFVLENGKFNGVNERFDLVFSSHCIEHQPNLIGHLLDVASSLNAGGRYAMIIPDARFCFDADLPLSCVSEVLQAHKEDRVNHSMASFIEHFALTTHNVPQPHWLTGKSTGSRNWKITEVDRVELALESWNAQSGYVDVHAWQFQPISFADIVTTLIKLDLIPFREIECYGTPFGRQEFMATLLL